MPSIPADYSPARPVSLPAVEVVAKWAAIVALGFPLLMILVQASVGSVAYLAFALVGSLFLYCAGWKAGAREWGYVILSTLAYVGLYQALGGAWSARWFDRLAGGTAFLGAGTMLVNWVRILHVSGAERQERMAVLVPAIMLPTGVYVSAIALYLDSLLSTIAWDWHLLAFDGRLGMQLSFIMGRLFNETPWLKELCATIYLGLPLALAVVYGLQLRRLRALGQAAPKNLILAFFVIPALGFLFYKLLPAIGPIYAFGDAYPYGNPTGALASFDAPALSRTNAFPSVHTALALIVFWSSKGLSSWTRAALALFLALTLMATLGLGEHYVIDLVVGVPFAAAMQALTMTGTSWRDPQRVRAMAWGLLIFFAWYAVVRLGLFNFGPALVWQAAVVATVGAGWRLAR